MDRRVDILAIVAHANRLSLCARSADDRRAKFLPTLRNVAVAVTDVTVGVITVKCEPPHGPANL